MDNRSMQTTSSMWTRPGDGQGVPLRKERQDKLLGARLQ